MDFKKVIDIIVKNFEAQAIEYAFIGGFALGAIGIARNTLDLDLLVPKKDLPVIDQIFQAHTYRLTYRSENVSQYVSDIKPFGSIDLLHAFRPRTFAMLQRVQRISIFEGQYIIPVVSPEDLIGLKLQALTNDPSRQTPDYADIELLLKRFQADVDWQLIAEYFELFGLQTQLRLLEEKYGKTE
jgi:hypothetical protein